MELTNHHPQLVMVKAKITLVNLLKDCSSNCFTCSETADYCTSCSSLQYLSHGVCYATCPPGTYEASSSTCDGKS